MAFKKQSEVSGSWLRVPESKDRELGEVRSQKLRRAGCTMADDVLISLLEIT